MVCTRIAFLLLSMLSWYLLSLVVSRTVTTLLCHLPAIVVPLCILVAVVGRAIVNHTFSLKLLHTKQEHVYAGQSHSIEQRDDLCMHIA